MVPIALGCCCERNWKEVSPYLCCRDVARKRRVPCKGVRPFRSVVALIAAIVPLSIAHSGSASTLPSPWHLDRINQTNLPLDGNVSMGGLTGAGINIYVVDTGVLATHEQFGGRVIAGIDLPTSKGTSPVSPSSTDCDGHGTHVAGLAAGSTVGVATQATVIAVRVLDCNGDGEVADVTKALQWVRAHHRSGTAAVLNLSLGVDLGDDGSTIDHEITSLMNEGVVVVVAAGNGDSSGIPFDACQIAPADVPRALTVGASTLSDAVATYSNYGPCVDIFAPGGDRQRNITSAWATNSTSYNLDAGTSMASPLVAGMAALLAQQQPGLCTDSIVSAVVERATPNVLAGIPAQTANRLLYVNTSPVAPTPPGQPSSVITTSDSNSIVVSWDPPCNGGSPITRTAVSLLSGGRVIKRSFVDATKNAVRFTGLVPGRTYQVVVKAENALGQGVATSRISTVAVRSIRRGQVVRTSLLAKGPEDISLKWSVSSSTRNICTLKQSPTRLVALRAGTCRVGLRQLSSAEPVLRSIRITP